MNDRICGAKNPVNNAVCELPPLHREEHYSHAVDDYWPLECGIRHPKNSRETCEKPRGHRGGHANTRWWWSA